MITNLNHAGVQINNDRNRNTRNQTPISRREQERSQVPGKDTGRHRLREQLTKNTNTS